MVIWGMVYTCFTRIIYIYIPIYVVALTSKLDTKQTQGASSPSSPLPSHPHQTFTKNLQNGPRQRHGGFLNDLPGAVPGELRRGRLGVVGVNPLLG